MGLVPTLHTVFTSSFQGGGEILGGGGGGGGGGAK